MMQIKVYLAEILGDKPVAIWLASFTFIIIGVIVSLRLSASKRNRDSKTTPYRFTWKFLFRDNISRFIGSVFVAFSIVRFGEELFNFHFGNFGCFLLGLCFDQTYKALIEWQKKAREILTIKE